MILTLDHNHVAHQCSLYFYLTCISVYHSAPWDPLLRVGIITLGLIWNSTEMYGKTDSESSALWYRINRLHMTQHILLTGLLHYHFILKIKISTKVILKQTFKTKIYLVFVYLFREKRLFISILKNQNFPIYFYHSILLNSYISQQ